MSRLYTPCRIVGRFTCFRPSEYFYKPESLRWASNLPCPYHLFLERFISKPLASLKSRLYSLSFEPSSVTHKQQYRLYNEVPCSSASCLSRYFSVFIAAESFKADSTADRKSQLPRSDNNCVWKVFLQVLLIPHQLCLRRKEQAFSSN